MIAWITKKLFPVEPIKEENPPEPEETVANEIICGFGNWEIKIDDWLNGGSVLPRFARTERTRELSDEELEIFARAILSATRWYYKAPLNRGTIEDVVGHISARCNGPASETVELMPDEQLTQINDYVAGLGVSGERDYYPY